MYDASLEEKFLHSAPSKIPFFKNGLPLFHQLLQQQPNNTRLFKFVADPPTVTMQRLKGLTAGSLPTFIDFRNNFDSPEIEEDNIIHQLGQSGRRVVFMGDDTWMNLFPGKFTRAYPYPSFNVKDLHTVDNGVIEHLLPEMKTTDWDVIIGHFLGVDHVGHRYEANHPAMREKLTQLNGVLAEVVEQMDNDTILLVFGDHGMTPDGNHGGTTAEEIDAALFAYSKKPFSFDGSELFAKQRHSVHQIDLVPTISLQLGLPIPFNSLGTAIPELFVVPQDSLSSDPSQGYRISATKQLIRRLQYVAKGLVLNCWQLRRYLQTYEESAQKFPSHIMAAVLESYAHVERHMNILSESPSESGVVLDTQVTQLKELISLAMQFLREGGDMCRGIWTTFDLLSMSFGIILLLLSLLFKILLFFTRKCDECYKDTEKNSVSTDLPLSNVLIGSFVGVVSFFFTRPLLQNISNISESMFCIGYCALCTLLLLILTVCNRFRKQLWQIGCRRLLGNIFDSFSTSVVPIVLGVLHGVGLFSNSYILAEPDIYRFLTCSVLFLYLRKVISKNLPLTFVLYCIGAMVCVGLTRTFETAGRQEAVDGEQLSIFELCWRTYLPLLLSSFLLIRCCRAFSPSHTIKDTKEALSSSWFFVFIILNTILLIVYWALQIIDHGSQTYGLSVANLFPKTVYLLSLVSLCFVILSVLIRAVPDNENKESMMSFVKVRQLCLHLGVCFFYPLALILGSESPMILFLFLLQVYFYIQLNQALSYNLSIPTVTLWYLLSGQYFLATGHRPTFSSLQISSAFVGFEQFNFWLSGTLLALNTFCAQLMCAVTFPLLLFNSVGTFSTSSGSSSSSSSSAAPTPLPTTAPASPSSWIRATRKRSLAVLLNRSPHPPPASNSTAKVDADLLLAMKLQAEFDAEAKRARGEGGPVPRDRSESAVSQDRSLFQIVEERMLSDVDLQAYQTSGASAAAQTNDTAAQNTIETGTRSGGVVEADADAALAKRLQSQFDRERASRRDAAQRKQEEEDAKLAALLQKQFDE
eukprot:GILK01012216.1.p1 GENE.GILK01012216.1~~GILK01012216.1.p1  ORF type:complete len:1093 (+),score=147.36 GILK01012216.1:172-3279(+)